MEIVFLSTKRTKTQKWVAKRNEKWSSFMCNIVDSCHVTQTLAPKNERTTCDGVQQKCRCNTHKFISLCLCRSGMECVACVRLSFYEFCSISFSYLDAFSYLCAFFFFLFSDLNKTIYNDIPWLRARDK